jgi:fucose permease
MSQRNRLLLLAYLAFVSLGLPDTTFGVAWPSLRHGFDLPASAIGAVLVAGGSGYFLSGLVAGSLMARAGVGWLLAGSSALVALGLVGYSLAPSWSAFFPVAFFVGLGSGAIDAALNAHAARHFSVRQVNWLHASWGVGASLGPVIMTAAIARERGYRAGYALLAGVLGSMALAFGASRRLWDDSGAAPASASGGASPGAVAPAASAGAALRDSTVRLSIAAFILYTGVESSVGQWCFTLLTEGRGLAVTAAGSWTAAYWASLTLGRVALGSVAERLGPDRLLRAASLGVVAGVALFGFSPGWLGRCGLLLLGASLAPMYPTLMARTPARVGARLAGHTVGFLVSAATLGSSLLPWTVGVLVGRLGLVAIGSVGVLLSLSFLLVHELLLRSGSHPSAPRPLDS